MTEFLNEALLILSESATAFFVIAAKHYNPFIIMLAMLGFYFLFKHIIISLADFIFKSLTYVIAFIKFLVMLYRQRKKR